MTVATTRSPAAAGQTPSRAVAGSDTANYSAISGALNISFDGVGNDGLTGEADNVRTTSRTSFRIGQRPRSTPEATATTAPSTAVGATTRSSPTRATPPSTARTSPWSNRRASRSASPTSSAKMSKSGTVAVNVTCPAGCTRALRGHADAAIEREQLPRREEAGQDRQRLASRSPPVRPRASRSRSHKSAKRTVKRKGKLKRQRDGRRVRASTQQPVDHDQRTQEE